MWISLNNHNLYFRVKPESDPDKRPSLMDDLKPEANGVFYDGDSDQDNEDEAES